jgi:phage-related baseplate assembly protein
VNAQDYTVRTYAMPAKFGSAAKAFVVRDQQINNIIAATTSQLPSGSIFVPNDVGQNIINLYVLGFDQNKKLSTLNMDVKQNLKTYIDQYRLLTDEVRILDAFVINIGINFKIVVFKGFNMNEVLVRCMNAIQDFFDIDRWQINQPIIMSDVVNEIANMEGVQSVVNLEIVNKYKFRDGKDYARFVYDISVATIDGVIYPSLDPSIWEIRYPETDIVGSASQ